MSRRLIAIVTAMAGGAAHAQPAAPAPDPGSPAPDPGSPAPDPGSPAPDPGSLAPPPDTTAPAPDPGSSAPVPLEPTAPSAPGPAGASAATPPEDGIDELGDQGISAQLGLATGGRVTPGGLRVAGHYLYQLSDRDWFDGAASFTFGSGRGACFRDRSDALVCDHGLADGAGVELSASVRRMFAPQGAFRPFARAGAGLGLVRFSGDDVSGGTIVLHGGGGVRASVAPSIAVVAEGELALGFGSFGRGLGLEPQLGLVVSAGAEFRLQ